MNGFVNYLFNIGKIKLTKNRDVNYFLEINNEILKFINKEIVGHLLEIDNSKLLEFINPIFNMG